RLPAPLLWGIGDPDRRIPEALLQQKKWIDVVVPRGGDGLIEFVIANSTIPIIKNDRGLCHVYVHEDGDLAMALEVVDHAKTQRPGVCSATETLLAHRHVAGELLPSIYRRISGAEAGRSKRVTWYCDDASHAILHALSGDNGKALVEHASAASFDTEY